jgi:hypothetical protein
MITDEDTRRLYLVIRGRSNIQYAAHDLLGLIKRDRDIRSSDSTERNRYEILVAATFSLWRAVF